MDFKNTTLTISLASLSENKQEDKERTEGVALSF